MKLFGLIGQSLQHSFSKIFFTEKFQQEPTYNNQYELFELAKIEEFPALIKKHEASLSGLNVTIPYKRAIIPYLEEIDKIAEQINAVNTIKFLSNGKLRGYNTDYYGFKTSIIKYNIQDKKALILGTGGASNAVRSVLSDLQISFLMVSRKKNDGCITYNDLIINPEWVESHQLIINATPLGTFPNIEDIPDLPYSRLSKSHILFDLVYNPKITAFMKKGIQAGSQVQNGYEMLVAQAEKSWEIWKS